MDMGMSHRISAISSVISAKNLHGGSDMGVLDTLQESNGIKENFRFSNQNYIDLQMLDFPVLRQITIVYLLQAKCNPSAPGHCLSKTCLCQ